MSLLFPIESTRVPAIVFMEGMNGTDYVHGVLESCAERMAGNQHANQQWLPVDLAGRNSGKDFAERRFKKHATRIGFGSMESTSAVHRRARAHPPSHDRGWPYRWMRGRTARPSTNGARSCACATVVEAGPLPVRRLNNSYDIRH